MERQIYLNEIYRELKSYLTTGIKGRLLSRIKNLNSDFAEQLKKQIYVEMVTLGISDKELMNQLADSNLELFTHFTKKINDGVKEILYTNIDPDKKIELLEHKYQAFKRYAKTWTYTGENAIAQTKLISDGQKAGFTKFKFVGALPERDFCKKHYNKSYTLEEINKLDNGQGLPVLFYGGGYNCRHRWVAEIEMIKDENDNVSVKVSVYPEDVFEKYFIKPKKIIYSKDMTEEMKKQYAEKLEELFRDYSKALKFYGKNQFYTLKFQSDAQRFGQVSHFNFGKNLLEINFGHKFDMSRGNGISYNIPKSTTDIANIKYATLCHEFVHFITINQQKNIDKEREEFWDEISKIKRAYVKDLRINAKDKNSDFFKQDYLGNYAVKNSNEFLAEAFTNYKLNSNPSKYAVKVGKLFDKYFKETK